jgi:hypothetical protein
MTPFPHWKPNLGSRGWSLHPVRFSPIQSAGNFTLNPGFINPESGFTKKFTLIQFSKPVFYSTGEIAVNTVSKAIASTGISAILLTTPFAANAFTYTNGERASCNSTLAHACKRDHMDQSSGATTLSTSTISSNSTYDSVSWVGEAQRCDEAQDSADGDDGYCTFDFSRTHARDVSWKVGVEVSTSLNVTDNAGMEAKVTAEYAKTDSDSDTYGTSKTIPVGYTILPYTYIPRARYVNTYKGYWKETGTSNCLNSSSRLCNRTYEWQKYLTVMTTSAFVATEDFQIMAYRKYANGTSSGIQLDTRN